MSKIRQCYEILKLNPGASPKEIKQAYKKLAKIWHPDCFIGKPEKQEEAEIEFKHILEAYEILIAYKSDDSQGRVETYSKTEIHQKKANPETLYWEGAKYMERGNYQEAIEAFTLAIRLDPNYIEAYQYRGFIFSKLGHENRAESDLRTAQELKLKQSIFQTNNVSEATTPSAKTVPSRPEAQTGKWIVHHIITVGSGKMSAVTISNDGKLFAHSDSNFNIDVCRLDTGKAIANFTGHKATVTCLTFSPDGQMLFSGSADKTIRSWHLYNSKSSIFGNRKSWHCDQVITLAISYDGKTLVSSSRDKTVKIWSINTATEPYTLTGYAAEVLALAISSKNILVTGGLEKHLRLRNVETGKLLRSVSGNSSISSVAFTPDGKLIAAGGFDRNIRLWEIATGQEIGNLISHSDRVSALTFNAEGNILVSGGWDGTVCLWQLNTGELINTFKGHRDKIICLKINWHKKTIFTASSDSTIKVWHFQE